MKQNDLLIAIAFFIIGMIVASLMVCNRYKREDINHDGKVDIHDLLIVQKYIIKEEQNDK